MQYETIIKNYSPELQLIDAIDMLKHYEPDAAEILDRWASESSNEKIDVESHQTDPNQLTFSQDIQLLSPDWEPQYTSQGDSISISLPDTDEEQVLEYPYPQKNKYPIQLDVDPSLDHHQRAKFD